MTKASRTSGTATRTRTERRGRSIVSVRRILLYLVLILAACAPTVIASRALPASAPAVAPASDVR